MSYFKTSYVEVYLQLYVPPNLLQSNFKTSYVEVYRIWLLCIRFSFSYFKTSYVEVYLNSFLAFMMSDRYFKTSYVEVYHEVDVKITGKNLHSKTSYVEVYPLPIFFDVFSISFQNILCWSLSIWIVHFYWFNRISKHLMLKFIRRSGRYYLSFWPHFKTSYVEVYRIRENRGRNRIQFQNILCWSLSRKIGEVQAYPHIFQNILCWSLSSTGREKDEIKIISKHLMLKFICIWYNNLCKFASFQNILCWSLSLLLFLLQHPALAFQNILCWSLSTS